MIIKKLGIDIVSGCQLKCVGCPNSTLDRKISFMSEDTLRQCLSNINVKVDLLRLYNFGEPLLHPEFNKMTKIVSQWGRAKTVEVSTNGQCGAKVAHELRKAKIDTLVVSCDGEGTRVEYERLRYGASWNRLVRFLNEAREATPKAKHIIRGMVFTKEGRKRWKEVAKGWKLECRTWHPFPKSAENPSNKVVHITKGACRYLGKDNLYVNYSGGVSACCVYPDAVIVGDFMSDKASRLLKHKRVLKAKMKIRRTGVCQECAF